MLEKQLASGAVRAKFEEMVRAQGGRLADGLPAARWRRAIPARESGVVQAIECDQIGYAVIALGGGRQAAGEQIDLAVGFEQPRKIGERVAAGEPLVVMHYNDETRAAAAERLVQSAYRLGAAPVRPGAMVTDRFE
jgi:pyrimidine-nucleoside phosphorylase